VEKAMLSLQKKQTKNGDQVPAGENKKRQV
jgi:hypothetical protein